MFSVLIVLWHISPHMSVNIKGIHNFIQISCIVLWLTGCQLQHNVSTECLDGVIAVGYHTTELSSWRYDIFTDTVQVDSSIISSVSIEKLCTAFYRNLYPIGKIPLPSSGSFATRSLTGDTLECLRILPPYLKHENFTIIGISCTIQPEVDPCNK